VLNRDVGIGCLKGIDHRLRARHIRVLGAGEKRDRCAACTAFAAAAAKTAGAASGGEQRGRCSEAVSATPRRPFLLNLMRPPGLKRH
jgi:hypothetical protein